MTLIAKYLLTKNTTEGNIQAVKLLKGRHFGFGLRGRFLKRTSLEHYEMLVNIFKNGSINA
ncbi:MAG: hypothetical protein ACI9TY_000974 [Alphaproteobacteria bacterium]|jgi:hypothetical protein